MLTIFTRGAGRMLLLFSILSITPLLNAKPEYRALWVDVFHSGLRSQAEADTMFETAQKAGYNTLVLEVRKACDAFYNSGLEPKNAAVQAGFDPLQYLLAKAHQSSPRMDVYAWLVTYRVRISGDLTWKNPQHIFQQHPEWLGEQRDGDKTGNASTYYLDPGVPQVIDYNLMVVRDLLSRYDVDGIVFDYVRYPEAGDGPSNWGYNDTAVQRFNKLYNKSGKPATDDPQFSDFRRMQIYDQVRKVYAHVRSWRPRVKIGAATITWGSMNGDFRKTSAYNEVMQDWDSMSMDGWLDVIMPMNYKREGIAAQARDHRDWAQHLGNLSTRSGRAGVNIVDGETLNSISGILTQISATRDLPGMDGISTYAYAEPHLGSGKIPDTEFFNTIKSKVFTGTAEVPDAPWLMRPSEGLIKGVVSYKGKPVDGATVQLGNRTTHTDGTGFYAFARVQPGNYKVSALNSSGELGSANTAVQAGGVAEAPIAASKP